MCVTMAVNYNTIISTHQTYHLRYDTSMSKNKTMYF